MVAQIIESFQKPLPEWHLPAEQQTRGVEVHLSDLLNVRQAVFKRLLPFAPNKREVLLWTWGRGWEQELARRTQMVSGQQRTVEGISMRPDFTEWPGYWRGPIEIKARRANLAKEGEELVEYDNYVQQAWGYGALTNTSNALLVVTTPRAGQVYSDPKAQTQPEIHVCEVAFTAEELQQCFEQLVKLRDQFRGAHASGDPSGLPLCYDWLCGTPTKVVTAKPRCITCNREFETQFGINKHQTSKTGAGHTVVDEQVRWNYEPRCKWYAFCRPNLVDASRGQTS